MSYTDKYSTTEECGCGKALVKFQPVFGQMDSYWTELINCQSRDRKYKREYVCSACGNVFDEADPSMIASESVMDNYKGGKYRSAARNQLEITPIN